MFFQRKIILIRTFKNYPKSSSAPSELYILSAVRTPMGLSNGALKKFLAPQLVCFAFKEALQRAVVPPEDIQNVFLGCSSNTNCHEEILKRTGLLKSVEVSSVSACALRNFIKGAKFLLVNSQTVCMVGGVVSMSNYIDSNDDSSRMKQILLKELVLKELIKSDYENFINACQNRAFHDEIAKINFRKKGEEIIVTEDELDVKNIEFSSVNKVTLILLSLSLDFIVLKKAPKDFKPDLESEFKYSRKTAVGSAAFVIASGDYVQNNLLTPIAKIISFAEESVKFGDVPSALLLAIEKALKAGACQCSSVTQWEIDSAISDMPLICIKHFNMNSSVVNRDGGVFNLGYPFGLSGAKALCHLAHSLPFGELGCAASFDFTGTASAVIIKKFHGRSSVKPLVTLYTKKKCPLCDELKDQLKPFARRFLLYEVDIEAEENKKYEKLYKYEIPVLFLAGRFLCKHKLDAQHFNRRLSEFEDFIKC